MHVLIADDARDVLNRVAGLLADVRGVSDVTTALDVPSAIAASERTTPDVAILDIRMPGGSGIEVLEHLKRRNPKTVVIIMTNFALEQYRLRCLAAGADYFLDKSAEFSRVPEIIRGLVTQGARATDA